MIMKLLPSSSSSSFSLVFTSLKNRWLHIFPQRLQDAKNEKPVKHWEEPSGFTTEIVIYNPIVKKKVPLILRNKGYATWYMCGPTVYDSAHIGHACSYVKLDIIRRVLVNHFAINLVTTMGITDIDDKIIKRSAEEKRDWKVLARFYENEFFSDMDALNVQRPYLSCRVSEHVSQIVEFIEKLILTDGAYLAKDGSVYFDTVKYNAYGKLGVKESDAPPSNVKRNNQDFALWKAARPDEPFWESPWGPGRPGWHIECSTMASEKLGTNIDIHSGGVDLIFPHHENEEAQSCRYHNVSQWVNYWLHTGHLHANNTKMSKSLGNTVSVSEFLKQYTADQFRLFCLLSYYRTGVEYTDSSMSASVTILKKIQSCLDDCNNYVNGTWPKGNVDSVALLQNLVETKEIVRTALADDFDTPKAIRAITSLVSIGNKMLQSPAEEGSARNPAVVAAVVNYITSTLMSFGMEIKTKSTRQSSVITEAADVIDSFVKFRFDVRNIGLEIKSKDKRLLQACDQARNDLSLHGVQIKDHGTYSTWSIRGINKS